MCAEAAAQLESRLKSGFECFDPRGDLRFRGFRERLSFKNGRSSHGREYCRSSWSDTKPDPCRKGRKV